MQIAHKIELKPNNKQKTYFKKSCGIARLCWNWALATWNQKYQENKKLKSKNVNTETISGMSLKKEFNKIKKNEFPFVYEVTKYAAQQPFLQLDQAFKRFFKKQSGFPKFKKKNKSVDSFYVGGDQVKVEEKKLIIPKLSAIRLKESLRFSGKINSVTISRTADRWYASIQVETDDLNTKKCDTDRSVGIDLGINHMLVLSNGAGVEAPKPLKKYLRKLKKSQRKLSKKIRLAKKAAKRLSDAKNLQKNKIKVAKIHRKISNIRKDSIHKVTSYITNNFLEISLEDLNVRGMLKNHKLSRAISDIGFGEISRQIEYKSKIRGNSINLVDRFFPSSKKCSICGTINDNLSLKDRIFNCTCGHKQDRDLNAAINLENQIDYRVRPARPEFTPEEMTAMQRSVYPIIVTSIAETGSKHQILFS